MIIVLASRKGGAGKTTILCNLAAELVQDGSTALIVDCDPLQGSLQWCAAREDHPKLRQIKAVNARAEKSTEVKIGDLRKKFDHILIDTPGHDEGGHRYVYGAADLLIFPLKPSQLDLQATVEWMKDLTERYQALRPSIKVATVLNECLSSSKRETREALAYCAHFGIEPLDARLASRIIYRDLIAEGIGITESKKDAKASDEFRRLSRELISICATPSHAGHTSL